MKRSQIVLFALFIVLTGLIYIPVAMNSKSYKKSIKEESKTVFVPIRKVNNAPHAITLSAYGQISPVTELMVAFEVQGKLIAGDRRLKPGTKFRKGEILYIVDAQEMIYTIAARKTSLAGMVANALPDLTIDFPSEQKKWLDFLDQIKPSGPLPEFPAFSTTKEKLFWTNRNVLSEYFNIKSLEKRNDKYLYVAPFSGTVTEIYAEPGSIINPGTQIAKIVKTGSFELNVPVAIEDLDFFKSSNTAIFTNADNKTVASGKILRISDVVNQRTQSVNVYYSVKPEENAIVYNGMFLNVAINKVAEKNTVVLPRTAVSDGKVFILEDTQLISTPIVLVGSKPDSVYVKGLNNGQNVVLEQISNPSKDVIYKGSER